MCMSLNFWKKLRNRFDDDVCEILQAKSKGGAENKLRALTTIISSFVSETFCRVVVRQKNDPYCKNRREIQIKIIRQHPRALKKQHKRESSEGNLPLAEIRDVLRHKLKSIRRAEWHWRRGKERARKLVAFISNLFVFFQKVAWSLMLLKCKLTFWSVWSIKFCLWEITFSVRRKTFFWFSPFLLERDCPETHLIGCSAGAILHKASWFFWWFFAAVRFLTTSRGLINVSLVTLVKVYDVERPKTLNDLGIKITDDVVRGTWGGIPWKSWNKFREKNNKNFDREMVSKTNVRIFQTGDIAHEKTRSYLQKTANLKRIAESLLTEAPNNARRTNAVKAKIDNKQQTV